MFPLGSRVETNLFHSSIALLGNGSGKRRSIPLPLQAADLSRPKSVAQPSGEFFASIRRYQRREIIGVQTVFGDEFTPAYDSLVVTSICCAFLQPAEAFERHKLFPLALRNPRET